MTKGFSKNNPLDNLSGRNTDAQKEIPTTVEPKQSKPKLQQNTVKKKAKYLRLDVTNCQDYVSLMAEHMTNTSGKYMSMTQYILKLIEADKQQNIELYEKLKRIEQMKHELI